MSNEPLGIYEELRAKARPFEDREKERRRLMQIGTYVPVCTPPPRPPPVLRPLSRSTEGGYYRRNPEHKRRRAEHTEGRLGLRLDQVIEAVCIESGIGRDELFNERRIRRLAWPRHVAMYLIDRYCPGYSLVEIGRLFHRDHTSVMHGIRMTAERLADDQGGTWELIASVHQRLAAIVEARHG